MAGRAVERAPGARAFAGVVSGSEHRSGMKQRYRVELPGTGVRHSRASHPGLVTIAVRAGYSVVRVRRSQLSRGAGVMPRRAVHEGGACCGLSF